MRRVIASEFVSLDGVIEDPSWTFQFSSEEQEKFKFDELAASDALLLGRVTYEGFAAAWPNMMERYQGPRRAALGEYAGMMNGYPKYVVSATLENAGWNNSTIIEGNVAEEVFKLKQQPGRDVLIFGSGDLVNALMQDDLIDEYRLIVFPIVVGSGKRLFESGGDQKALELVETKTFGSGVVVLFYQPAGNGAGEWIVMVDDSTNNQSYEQSGPNPTLRSLDVMVGTWDLRGRESGPDGEINGRTTFEWMEGGFYLVQRVDIDHAGRRIVGTEYIGYDESNEVLKSYFFSNYGPGPFGGVALEYVWEVARDDLTIWGGYVGSPASFKGRFGDSRDTVAGRWEWPGGGYEATMTRVE